MLNLLQSWEAALIPSRLELFYHSTSAALSAYGVFTGMAMPLIMLPCTITGSFSLMLLPSVSEAHALGDGRKIEETVRSSLALCVFMGVLSTAGFLCFGSSLGLLLYGDARVGGYLTTPGLDLPVSLSHHHRQQYPPRAWKNLPCFSA